MTDIQLYMAIGIPMLFNATLTGILVAYMASINTGLNKRIEDIRDMLRAEAGKNQSELLVKFAELDHRIERLEQPRARP